MDKKSLQKMIDENGIKYIDFRFTDPLGTWQHFSNHINTFEMMYLRKVLVSTALQLDVFSQLKLVT